MKIVIANKNYSTWSLRAWLVLEASGLPYEEVLIDLDAPDTADRIAEYSSAGRVPVLIDGELTIWDSLAIAEYLAEKAPAAGLWPADPTARAVARAITAEMHAGFQGLRSHYPMNIRRAPAEREPTPSAAKDISRVREIWRTTRARFGGTGDFLFGPFTIADAFYAPVVSRFETYRIPVGEMESAYMDAVMAYPPMKAWADAGRAETWVVPSDEVD